MQSLKSLLFSCNPWISNAASRLPQWNSVSPIHADVSPRISKRIEDYRAGYPQLSALISAYDGFFVCRSFRRIRARLLFTKQDRLSVLEQQLDQIDQEEAFPLFLGKLRGDRNAARTALLAQISADLADYDSFVEQTRRALDCSAAVPRDVQSIRNWLDGTGNVSSSETAFLDFDREMMCLAPAVDNATKQLETWVEDKLIRYYPKFRGTASEDISTDEDVYIYSGSLIKHTARAALLLLVSLVLLTPVIICNALLSVAGRMCVIAVSMVVYLTLVSILARSKTMELIIGGATFATILIAFVSGNNPNSDATNSI